MTKNQFSDYVKTFGNFQTSYSGKKKTMFIKGKGKTKAVSMMKMNMDTNKINVDFKIS